MMKFGGTSVADADRIKRAARRIVDRRAEGHSVVAVLSARGKTTDQLIEMAQEVSATPDPREMDMLLSSGERISCALCAMVINDLGHRAVSLTGSQAGIVTDESHTKALIIDVRADRIKSALDEGHIVLVAGFQGVSQTAKNVTTLGRGGSDTSAVAVAAALGADVCEIYTDVAGVYSADPRIVPDARKLDTSRSTRCSRWRRPVRASYNCDRLSTRVITTSRSTAGHHSRTSPARSCRRKETRWRSRSSPQ